MEIIDKGAEVEMDDLTRMARDWTQGFGVHENGERNNCPSTHGFAAFRQAQLRAQISCTYSRP